MSKLTFQHTVPIWCRGEVKKSDYEGSILLYVYNLANEFHLLHIIYLLLCVFFPKRIRILKFRTVLNCTLATIDFVFIKRKPNRYLQVTLFRIKIFIFIRFAAKKNCSGFYEDDQICKTGMHYLIKIFGYFGFCAVLDFAVIAYNVPNISEW